MCVQANTMYTLIVKKNITVPLPRHSGDMPKGTLRTLIKEIGFSVDEFLSL